MMALLKDVVRKEFKKAKPTFEQEISAHHNYVAEERYEGMDLLVTRKGRSVRAPASTGSSLARWARARTS